MAYKLLNISNKLEKQSIKHQISTKGYKLPSRNKCFIIQESKVFNIRIINKKLAHPFIYKNVHKKYIRLIESITNLLISDDDTGASCREALNQLERFKSIVKEKYRIYLSQKELKEMADNLKMLQKQAKIKEMQLYENQKDFSQKRTR